MKLFITGIELDLDATENISRTLQVNDIASLSNRQSNYTNTYSLPMTAKNVRAMKMLGVVGNDSFVPYQRNECFLYADSGECLIYNGWAVITATSKEYKLNVYDGNIDLYKAIENRSLAELPLSEINHLKNLTNIINSWDIDSPYKYIIADYNGKMLYDTTKINFDYLVPSVHVPYLWDKIFTTYGFTYEGSVFDSFNFQNLWMTFPKGIGSTAPDVLVYESDEAVFQNHESSLNMNINPTLDNRKTSYFERVSDLTNDLLSVTFDKHFTPVETGIYRLEITGAVLPLKYIKNTFPLALNYGTFVSESELWLGKNSEAITNSDNVVLVQKLQDSIDVDTPLNIDSLITLNENESFCFVLKVKRNQDYISAVIYPDGDNLPKIKVSKVVASTIDFQAALIDFKTKDFLNEVLTRLSITPYKDKYSNNYRFLTLEELLQDNEVVDWSAEKSKFVRNLSERYTYGSYAQKNDFNYKYNDQEADHNNGSILVNNVNLNDERTVLNSRIYSPERIKTNELFKETNVYKLWDKEVKDNGDVTYKPLDKRYYFMRYDTHYFDEPQIIGSETLAVEQSINSAPYESFYKLDFNAILQDYYSPINQILNKAKILDNEIFLHDQDIEQIDFSKLYWVRELNSYFVLNKVNNYQGKGITKCEMIKVDYSPIIANLTPDLTVTFVEYFLDDVTTMARYVAGFDTTDFDTSMLTYVLDGGAPVSIGITGFFGFVVEASLPPVSHTIYVTDGNVVTDTVTFVI